MVSAEWLLEKAAESYNRRDWEAVGGWLARLRRGMAIGFPPPVEALADVEDLADPYRLLERAIEAKRAGRPALAAGWLARLHRVFGCPPFDDEYDVTEAMELAGFGQVVLVDTGVGLPPRAFPECRRGIEGALPRHH